MHPLLATRGPPGTHDVALACATLDALRRGDAVRLPAFDKLADRRVPEARWRDTAGAELVVFEGWCLGTPAQPDGALDEPVNALEREEDADGTWRRFCNDALARDYPALWQRIDRLVFLQPPGFDIVPEWRWQQEQSLQATDPSRMGMTRAQVERFVRHTNASAGSVATLPVADVGRADAERSHCLVRARQRSSDQIGNIVVATGRAGFLRAEAEFRRLPYSPGSDPRRGSYSWVN